MLQVHGGTRSFKKTNLKRPQPLVSFWEGGKISVVERSLMALLVLQVLRPKPVRHTEMTRFHSDDYINFLRVITPDNMSDYMRQLQR